MVKTNSYKANSSDNPDRKRKNGNMRDRSTINRIHMYREGKAKHDRNGKVIGGSLRSSDKTANQLASLPTASGSATRERSLPRSWTRSERRWPRP